MKVSSRGYGDAVRGLGHGKGAKVSLGRGTPSKREGSDGDLTLRSTNSGVILFAKYGGRWYSMHTQQGLVPGMIIMWAGEKHAIPIGWTLCDGSSSTPDLRAKFIIGSGNNAVDFSFNDSSCDTSTAGGSGTTFGSNPKIVQIANTNHLQVGMAVAGTGVSDGTLITSIDNTTLFRTAASSTSNETDTTLTFTIEPSYQGQTFGPNRSYSSGGVTRSFGKGAGGNVIINDGDTGATTDARLPYHSHTMASGGGSYMMFPTGTSYGIQRTDSGSGSTGSYVAITNTGGQSAGGSHTHTYGDLTGIGNPNVSVGLPGVDYYSLAYIMYIGSTTDPGTEGYTQDGDGGGLGRVSE